MQELEPSCLDVGKPGARAGAMVGHPRILFAVGANLVAPLATTDLDRAHGVSLLLKVSSSCVPDASLELGPGLAPILMLVASVDLDGEARWQVREHHAAVGLVLVLSARPAVSREAHLHFVLGERERTLRAGLEHRHGDCRAVDAAASLAGWLTLPAVPAGFLVKRLERPGRTAQLKEQSAEFGLLLHGDAVTLRVGFVERGLNQDQRLRIVTAFSGTNLQMQLHRRLQVVGSSRTPGGPLHAHRS